jgi:RNA polymerase sigma-70 factor (ECF subfamily)
MIDNDESETPEDPPADGHADVVVHEDFEAFYNREIRNVIGLVYVLSGSRSGAEDLAHDAFLVTYRHWSHVHVLGNPGAWVRRVAINRSISAGRRRVAEAKALLRLGGHHVEIAEPSDNSDELWSAVRQLPRRQAQVIALRYWDRCSASEIAQILELSEATVKSHLQRARQTLADTYRKA